MKLYMHPKLAATWIGEDDAGRLERFPAEAGGWARRTPWIDGRRGLKAVEPAAARGTGWPGAGAGRRRLSASGEASVGKLIKDAPETWGRLSKRAAATGENVNEIARRAFAELLARES